LPVRGPRHDTSSKMKPGMRTCQPELFTNVQISCCTPSIADDKYFSDNVSASRGKGKEERSSFPSASYDNAMIMDAEEKRYFDNPSSYCLEHGICGPG